MPDPFLTANQDDINNFNNKSSNPINSSVEHIDEEETPKQGQQINCLSELSLAESDSFYAVLKRLCFYWRRIILQKIRVVLTVIFMSMLNITTRLTCFTRQRTPTSSFNTSTSSSTIRTLEEDLNNSSNSPLLIENTHQQQISLPSLENPTMARILIQQKTHRTPNISINRSTTSHKDSSLLMRHSVDDRLFYHDSTRLLHFFTRVSSEPQISKYNSQSTNSNGDLNQSLRDFSIPLPLSGSCFQFNGSTNDEIHFNGIFQLNCDKIQPVSNSSTESFTSDKIDNINSTTNNLSEERIIIDEEIVTNNQQIETSQINGDLEIPQINVDVENTKLNGDVEHTVLNDDSNSPLLNEDTLTDTNSLLNDTDGSGERHFRRRKRRTSLTKTSISLDETQITIDLIEKVTTDNELAQTINENLKLTESDDKENRNTMETDTSENKESTQTTDDVEKPTSLSRHRGRRLRHQFYRHSVELSSPQDITPNTSTEFFVFNEKSSISISKSSTSPVNISPSLLNLPVPSNHSPIPGGLKRTGSGSSIKKNVRFADSIGLELTKVQYINSSISDESNEFSFLLGSSLLSSSPPSFTKSNLYLPTTSCLEHKPWSFDVKSKPIMQSNDKNVLKRFYCLFRQPDSEHPDIYLHEVWKSQIKLEHADIPFKISSTGEQQLNGTVWVTNAGFQKNVSVKYTFNNWLNVYEHDAQYCRHSNDYRNIDQFQFSLNIPKDIDRIDFVLRYSVNGQEYWDNNLGKNYTIRTDSAYTISTTISLPHDCDFNEMRFY